MSKRVVPSISKYCVTMMGSAPKSIDNIIQLLKDQNLDKFYILVGIRATLGWHDQLSGSKSVFVSTEPFDVKPSTKTFYSAIKPSGAIGCIDQAFWAQCQLYFDGSTLNVLDGVFDNKSKRTIGLIVPLPIQVSEVG